MTWSGVSPFGGVGPASQQGLLLRTDVHEIRRNHLAPGTPLRYGVEATRRLRAADAELEAALVAYEAAQDLAAPED